LAKIGGVTTVKFKSGVTAVLRENTFTIIGSGSGYFPIPISDLDVLFAVLETAFKNMHVAAAARRSLLPPRAVLLTKLITAISYCN
jgi:hypothetical protein